MRTETDSLSAGAFRDSNRSDQQPWPFRPLRYPGDMSVCFNCDQNAQLDTLPIRDRIHIGEHWRIVHAWSALPGWLVVISRRHLLSLADQTPAEAADLGLLLRAASAALTEVVGCAKTYVIMYVEVAGFEHIHLHLVPRMPDLDQSYRGSGIFQLLKRPESEWVSAEERDRLATLVQAEIARRLLDA
jgi:diadenosine tetraphosphate (Ap4A) HIT family hydrolase